MRSCCTSRWVVTNSVAERRVGLIDTAAFARYALVNPPVGSPEHPTASGAVMTHPLRSCHGPMSRRHFLQVGALTLGGVGLQGVMPWKLRATEAGDATPETAVILVWLP